MQIIKAKENLSEYFKKRAINIEKILSIPPEQYGKEEYHKLRVEIKKIHAILDLLNYCQTDFQKNKYFKPFKEIFIQSGKIRELQLEESVLEKYNTRKIENVLLKVKKEINKEKRNFCLLIQKKQKIKIEKKINKIVLHLEEIPDDKVNEYIEMEKKNINNLIRESPLVASNLHELRKTLKRNFYSRESLNMRDKNKKIKEDNFQELIGNWHDSKIMSDLIERSIIKKKINTEELKQLLQIDEELNVHRRLLYNEINNTVMTNDIFE